MRHKLSSIGSMIVLVTASARPLLAGEKSPNAPSDAGGPISPAAPAVATPPAAEEPAKPSESPAREATQAPCKPFPNPFTKPCGPMDGEEGVPWETGCAGVFGVRGAFTRLGSGHAQEGTGLMVSGQQEEYTRRGHWVTRDGFRFALGGGGAGFEGGLFGSWAGGVRIPVGSQHGPVLRAGLLGYLRGNNAYYESLLELPQVQVGYQYMHGNWVLEAGGTSGAVLAGRSRTGDTLARELGAGFEFGGYAAIQGPWFRLGVTANSLPTADAYPKWVQVLDGTLCALMTPFALCADARANFAQAVTAPSEPASDVRWVQVGIMVGFTREGERIRTPQTGQGPSGS